MIGACCICSRCGWNALSKKPTIEDGRTRTTEARDKPARHLEALGCLFVQVLKLAEKAGLVKLGHVSLDGTKIKANASKHKAMSYERMKKREAELQAEVNGWLAAAEAADAQEDKLHGAGRGDEMPDWVADKHKRLEKIRQAKAALEAEAKAAAEEERRRRAAAEDKRQAEGRQKSGRMAAPPREEPDGKAHRNFTDPESRILKTKDGYIQGFNAQVAVDGTAQIIVAQGLTPSTSDQDQLVPLVDAIETKPRSQAEASLGRCRLLLRGKPRRPWPIAASAPTSQPAAPNTPPTSNERSPGRSPGHARQAQAGRTAKSVQAAKADRRAGVRTDQAGTRLPPVPVAWRRESTRRMGVDLHRPQPHQARQGRLTMRSFVKPENPRAIWTGS